MAEGAGSMLEIRRQKIIRLSDYQRIRVKNTSVSGYQAY